MRAQSSGDVVQSSLCLSRGSAKRMSQQHLLMPDSEKLLHRQVVL